MTKLIVLSPLVSALPRLPSAAFRFQGDSETPLELRFKWWMKARRPRICGNVALGGVKGGDAARSFYVHKSRGPALRQTRMLPRVLRDCLPGDIMNIPPLTCIIHVNCGPHWGPSIFQPFHFQHVRAVIHFLHACELVSGACSAHNQFFVGHSAEREREREKYIVPENSLHMHNQTMECFVHEFSRSRPRSPINSVFIFSFRGAIEYANDGFIDVHGYVSQPLFVRRGNTCKVTQISCVTFHVLFIWEYNRRKIAHGAFIFIFSLLKQLVNFQMVLFN